MERDPSSVQVVLKESIVEGQQTILLEDENGTLSEMVTPEHSRDPTPTLSEVTSTEDVTVKDGSQQQGTSSESETEDEQLQSGQRELQVQLQIAKNEISVLTDKLEQQELCKQFLEQSLNDAGEKIKQLMTETGLAYSETENLKRRFYRVKRESNSCGLEIVHRHLNLIKFCGKRIKR